MNELLNTAKNSLTEFSAAIVVLNILVSFVLSLLVSWVYTRTHRSISYSRSYLNSLVMMSILAAVAMMILGNNLTRALGVLGVFTLIRFRTIVKDTKDATFLFFALAIGMAVGTSNYAIAGISTVLLCAILYGLDRIGFGSYIGNAFLLTFSTGDRVNSEQIDKVFIQFLANHTLLQVKTGIEHDRVYYYKVRLRNVEKFNDLLNALQQVEGIKMADLVTGRDAVEY